MECQVSKTSRVYPVYVYKRWREQILITDATLGKFEVIIRIVTVFLLNILLVFLMEIVKSDEMPGIMHLC